MKPMKIEAIRIQLGLTRKQMADALGCTLDRYHRLAVAKSKLRIEELIALQKLSGLRADEIDF